MVLDDRSLTTTTAVGAAAAAWMIAAAVSMTVAVGGLWWSGAHSQSRRSQRIKDDVKSTNTTTHNNNYAPPKYPPGLLSLIGNTPLIEIPSLSRLTGCKILAKAEFLNPSGSSKDRIAREIVLNAEKHGLISPHSGCVVFEGTVGSTGISLATVCRARGHRCHIIMPDDVAKEKRDILIRLGATVELVRPVSIVDKDHYVRLAKRRCDEMNRSAEERGLPPGVQRGYFCDQFENIVNFQTHLHITGPEISHQLSLLPPSIPHPSAVVMGAGTGGTLAGLAHHFKCKTPEVQMILADPQGSGLYNRVMHGIMYAPTEKEGGRRRHQVDSVVEGVGINRLTANFEMALGGEDGSDHSRTFIDGAVRVEDQEAVDMSRFLLNEDGLFVGSSSAVHFVAAYRTAVKLGPGHTVLTFLCDHGSRHLTKFWNDDALRDVWGLDPEGWKKRAEWRTTDPIAPAADGTEELEDDPLPMELLNDHPEFVPSRPSDAPRTVVNSQPLDGTPFIAPFVPSTPQQIQEALSLASVCPTDVLIDLGAGDGRICFAAIQMMSSAAPRSCVAVELDPHLSAYIRANAPPRVRVVEANMFDVDLESLDGTVMILYLLPAGLEKLKGPLARWLNGDGVDGRRRCVTIEYAIPGWDAETLVTDPCTLHLYKR